MREPYASFSRNAIPLASQGDQVLLGAMDHTEFLAQMPAERTKALSVRSNRAGLVRLAGHMGLIALTGSAVTLALPGWPLLLPLRGVFIVFLFALEHEATHQTPFASRRLNECIGHTVGVINLLPFQWFRYFHLAHHRHTHDPDKDPELLAGAKPDTWRSYLWHVSGIPTWIALMQGLFINAMGRCRDDFLPKRARSRITIEARAYLTIYALVLFSMLFSSAAFWLWILPSILGQPFLRLYLLAEHSRCPHVADMLANTRTTFTTGFVRFIAWNMPYHIEHHTMPNVPFHQLPALHQDMAKALKETANGYGAFTKSYVATLER